MNGAAGGATALGWSGLAVGLAGLGAYILLVLRKPEAVRILHGAGLLLTSLALTQSRTLIAATQGGDAFVGEAVVTLLMLAVAAQAIAGWRNRRAWDGMDRRRPAIWDGAERRGDGFRGEERA